MGVKICVMKMKALKLIFGLLLVFSISLAIQPVADWTSGPQQKISYTATPFITEGGNVTELNLSANISTEKWAGLWGNISGQIMLSDGSNTFYSWSWTSANGGVVCAQPSATADFDWTSAAAATAGDVDNAFSFATGDTDSATSTLTQSCSITISGSTVSGAAAQTASGFQTCALKDTGTPTKGDLSFCTDISSGTTLFNSKTGDYALLLPTNENAGQTETYVFWLELH